MNEKDKPYFPKITASSVEQFKEIEEKVKLLPQKIIDQIEVVTSFYKITCHLKEQFDSSKYIFLPTFITQIATSFDKDSGLEVGIYADDYLFKIEWKHKKDAIVNYQLIDCPNFKK